MTTAEALDRFIYDITTCESQDAAASVFETFLENEIGTFYYMMGETGPLRRLPDGRHGNYPVDWLEVYLTRGYFYADPIVARSLSEPTPFTWAEDLRREYLNRRQRRVMSAARDFGLVDGVTFPVVQAGTYQAGLSLAAEKLDLHPAQISLLHLCLVYFHGRMLSFQDNTKIIRDDLILTRRESECLQWVAKGKTDWEIGEILSIAETTVHSHIENAKMKLNAVTRAQAVTEALRRGFVVF